MAVPPVPCQCPRPHSSQLTRAVHVVMAAMQVDGAGSAGSGSGGELMMKALGDLRGLPNLRRCRFLQLYWLRAGCSCFRAWVWRGA